MHSITRSEQRVCEIHSHEWDVVTDHDAAEIKESARALAYDLMLQYDGNQTGMIPGILPGPPTEYKGDYYWWEGGAMMGTYIGAFKSASG
jgi:hypothetical protein